MPTFFEILDSLKSELSRRRPDLDVSVGTVLHDLLATYAYVLEKFYNEVDMRVLLRSLDFASNFSSDELDKFAESFGVTRLPGSFALGSVTFRSNTIPDRPIFIPAGFKVSTIENVTFETTVPVTLSADTLIFNPDTGLYEVTVPIRCLVAGSIGNVPSGSIVVPEYEIAGISVWNYSPTSGGVDSESNSSLIERIKTKLKGNSLGTYFGYYQLFRPLSTEIQIVGPREPEMLRDEYGGCVDVYLRSRVEGVIEGEAIPITSSNISEISTLGYKLKLQPVIRVNDVTVSRLVDGNVVKYHPDFVLERDYGLFSKSVKASDRVRLLNFTLQEGDILYVDYVFNATIRQAQDLVYSDENRVLGIDVLVRDFNVCYVRLRESRPSIKVTFEYRLEPEKVLADVEREVSNFIRGLPAGSKLSLSDLVGVMEHVRGVDYILIENLIFEKRFEWESSFSLVQEETVSLNRTFYFEVDSITLSTF